MEAEADSEADEAVAASQTEHLTGVTLAEVVWEEASEVVGLAEGVLRGMVGLDRETMDMVVDTDPLGPATLEAEAVDTG